MRVMLLGMAAAMGVGAVPLGNAYAQPAQSSAPAPLTIQLAQSAPAPVPAPVAASAAPSTAQTPCTGTPDPYKNYACLDAYLGDNVFERLYNYYKLEMGQSGCRTVPSFPPASSACSTTSSERRPSAYITYCSRWSRSRSRSIAARASSSLACFPVCEGSISARWSLRPGWTRNLLR
jgi:hypothetical protein